MKPIPKPILELASRAFSKNPKFFQYVQILFAVVACISFVPELLSYLSVAVPTWLSHVDMAAVKVGTLVGIFMAQLPNNEPSKEEPKP
jgi:hypothetical protein